MPGTARTGCSTAYAVDDVIFLPQTHAQGAFVKTIPV